MTNTRHPTPPTHGVHILATLCRFDSFMDGRSYPGPFIPWERRLAYMEIREIQGRDIEAGFLI